LLSPFTEKETTRNIRWMSRKMTGYVGARKSCFHKNYMVYDEVDLIIHATSNFIAMLPDTFPVLFSSY
jgi:hypothetical protein